MATKDGRAQIWYADGSGNVTGYTESVDEIAGTIIDAYNEHFGTDIALWTPETKTLQVGDTVPNWDAYEKIELATILVKTDIGGVFAFGVIENSTLKVEGQNSEDKVYVADSGGVIRGSAGNAQAMITNMFIPRLISQGYNVDMGVINDANYSEGQTIDNWNDYVIITA